MKFTILQQDLYPALSGVARACGVRSQLPVLGNILLRAEGGKLTLAATDLEIGVIKTIKVDIEEDGEVTIPAKTLVEVVSNLGGEKVCFLSSGDQLQISTSSFSGSLNGISATEFPSIPLTGKDQVSVSPKMLVKSLPQILFAAAADEGRPILTGILTEIKDKKIQFVATDGYRLAHKIVPVEEEATFRALVPKRTYEELVRIISEEEADAVFISTSEDQNQVIFSIGNTKLSSRLIEGNFPSWEKIIPETGKARVMTERGELAKAVKLASIFAKNEANVVKLQNPGDGKLILTSEAKELGSQKKEVEGEISGEELQVAFNTKFLQDVLTAFSTQQVVIELSGNLSAAVIKPMGEEGLQYIIMPVNLS